MMTRSQIRDRLLGQARTKRKVAANHDAKPPDHIAWHYGDQEETHAEASRRLRAEADKLEADARDVERARGIHGEVGSTLEVRTVTRGGKSTRVLCIKGGRLVR